MEMKQQPRKIMVNLGLAFYLFWYFGSMSSIQSIQFRKLNAKNCKSVITDHWKDIERTSPRQLQGLLMVLG
ncbi:unnamed protein product [Prunus armeniaca]|uniref:Uncharacterized protein n=1 Tax=Prunus armeniaca TaxID=36596 RepID=A0A6J5WI41_PRUAR|nr:unnamed protein product [Prunus armeniaca]